MSPQNPDAVVAQKAAVQYGNVTHRQLIDAGLTDTAIGWRVRRGRLYRVHAQVYAVGHPPRLPLERAAAAVLACGPGAALSHSGALALWGFSKQWPDAFDVIVPTRDRRPDGITTHRYTGLIRRDLTVQLGIRATSPARTVLDCLPDLGDRQRGAQRGVGEVGQMGTNLRKGQHRLVLDDRCQVHRGQHQQPVAVQRP